MRQLLSRWDIHMTHPRETISYSRDLRHACGGFEDGPESEALRLGIANHEALAKWVLSGYKVWDESIAEETRSRAEDALTMAMDRGYTIVLDVEESQGGQHPHHPGKAFRVPILDRWDFAGARDLLLAHRSGDGRRAILDWKLRTVPGPNQLRGYSAATMLLDSRATEVEGWYVPLAEGAPGMVYAGRWGRAELPDIEKWIDKTADLSFRLRQTGTAQLQSGPDSKCAYCLHKATCVERRQLVALQNFDITVADPQGLVTLIEKAKAATKLLGDLEGAALASLEAMHQAGQLPRGSPERAGGTPTTSTTRQCVRQKQSQA